MNKLKFKPTTTKHNNNTNNNNQLTPELNHHLILSRRSRALAQALPTQARKSNSSSQTATNSQTNPQTKPQTNPQTNPAFTIIEVVLVLAIAGLIFLMVFIALPALQRNQRDTQRKNDIARIVTQFQNYTANNKGKYVSDDPGNSQLKGFIAAYLVLADEFSDPSTGEPYKIVECQGPYGGCIRNDPEIGEVNYNSGAYCDGENWVDIPNNRTFFALRTKLESGGYYCVDTK